MVSVDKDCHLGRGDHLEYLAIADKHDTKAEVIAAVNRVFRQKFGANPKRATAFRASNGAWVVQVYPPL